ncbi:uncharacterized protein LOC120070883 [Benincasa hispida]|uniref:uncharacterized protein LOC120070883 n=1 Tax=Benincasa hispida TaxID=102211 RepID=UPI0018FFABF0|nr:uncharacterized protein LOC120070883 [Benincasa hispida]
MAREKSPGLKILWVWTLGTAAILITSVARMRMRDMENIINSDQQPSLHHQQTSSTDSFPITDSFSVDEGDASQVEVAQLGSFVSLKSKLNAYVIMLLLYMVMKLQESNEKLL